MNRRRRNLTAGVVALLFALGGPAYAACPGSSSGNSTVHLTTYRWTYGAWNAATDTFDMTAYADTTLASGKCVIAWFDWYTNGTGHFDERAARTCQGESHRSVNGSNDWQEASYANRTLTALHVLAVCFGQIDTMGNCEESSATSCPFDAVIIPDLPNGQTSAWIRRADGTMDVWLSSNDIVGYE